MENHAAIVEWMKSTALRPYLDRLPSTRQEPVLAAVPVRLKQVYPTQRDGKVLFVFRRRFFIAYRTAKTN
jgi:trans-aconitate 2-methyltransferase